MITISTLQLRHTLMTLMDKARTLLSGVSRLPRRRLAMSVVAGVFLLGVAGVLISPHVSRIGGSPGAGQAAAEAYKETLKGQVDTGAGTPRDGRDPSSQQQSSLAGAASMPQGNGTRTDKPAAGVSGHDHHAAPSDVYGDPAKTGINSAGCFIDYGVPGEQCVPAGLANADGSLSCDKVRTKFASGVVVSGKDRFHLDHNGDGWACGRDE